ncbi:MAG: hypothetical protein BGO87_13785 [Flavobacteriia bacterium 40-80]|nr:MAG: hypothetical protein BGO87_13785 [Flavobacteriia bacterium 40-80]
MGTDKVTKHIFSRNTIIKMLCFYLIYAIVIYVINRAINNYNMQFYKGKDDGFFVRIESILIFSIIFFALTPQKLFFSNFILGFFYGLLCVIIGYFIWFKLFDDDGISFHVLSSVFIFIFYLVHHKFIRPHNTEKW